MKAREALVRRAGLVAAIAGTALLSAALARGGWQGLARWGDLAEGARTPAALLAPICALAAALVLAWLAVAGTVAVLVQRSGSVGRHAESVAGWTAPALVRTAVAAALSGSLALAAAPPGAAPVRGSVAVGPVTPAADHRADPGPHLPAPRVRPMPDVGLVSTAPAPARRPALVRVRPGDSLWTIAARRLGPGATDADIAREWPRWYAANRSVIGADPDVLHPGQLLDVPAGHPATGATS